MAARKDAAAGPINPERLVVPASTDVGPPERAQHDVLAFRGSGVPRAVVETQTWLDRYRYSQAITRRQFHAGDRLRIDWHESNSAPRLVPELGRVPGGQPPDPPDGKARSRFEQAQRALRVGFVWSMVFGVCCLDESAGAWAVTRGISRRTGIDILRLGLNCLADAYGFPAEPETKYPPIAGSSEPQSE